MNEKYTVMNPFDITTKIFGPYLFSATARESLGEKMDLYFQDHSLVPLFIQVHLCTLFCVPCHSCSNRKTTFEVSLHEYETWMGQKRS